MTFQTSNNSIWTCAMWVQAKCRFRNNEKNCKRFLYLVTLWTSIYNYCSCYPWTSIYKTSPARNENTHWYQPLQYRFRHQTIASKLVECEFTPNVGSEMTKKTVKDLQVLLLFNFYLHLFFLLFSELLSTQHLRQAMRTDNGTSLYNVISGTKK
jgi:hypothetical protein